MDSLLCYRTHWLLCSYQAEVSAQNQFKRKIIQALCIWAENGENPRKSPHHRELIKLRVNFKRYSYCSNFFFLYFCCFQWKVNKMCAYFENQVFIPIESLPMLSHRIFFFSTVFLFCMLINCLCMCEVTKLVHHQYTDALLKHGPEIVTSCHTERCDKMNYMQVALIL